MLIRMLFAIVSFFCYHTATFANQTAENSTCSSQVERTFTMIKPNAVKDGHIGDIVALYEKGNLKVTALRMTLLDEGQAQDFYAVHKGKPFFQDLVKFMSSGPIVAIVLEGENAVLRCREIMGATDPKKASPDTIRGKYGLNITQNAIHGSDSKENAAGEIAFFFKDDEIYTCPIKNSLE